MPKSRLEFWRPKLQNNRRRDAKNRRNLRQLGWKTLVVWECQVQRWTSERLLDRLVAFLDC